MCKFLHKLFFKRVVVFLVSLMIFMPFGWIASKARLASKDQSLTIKEYYPSLNFSTYLGGGGNDCGSSIDVASDGCCYMTGDTTRDFPTLNAYNETNGGAIDAFVAKISDSGSLLWSTFLGGSGWDSGSCIAVASDGSCYVSGWTSSSNFPTKNAYNSTYGGMKDAFVAKFNSSGSLLWSTFLGGSNSDYGYGIDVDSDGSCYVTGSTTSSNFPTLYAYDSVLD